MFSLEFSNSTKKDLKRIDKHYQMFILDSLEEFVKNFSSDYEASLIVTGKISNQ